MIRREFLKFLGIVPAVGAVLPILKKLPEPEKVPKKLTETELKAKKYADSYAKALDKEMKDFAKTIKKDRMQLVNWNLSSHTFHIGADYSYGKPS